MTHHVYKNKFFLNHLIKKNIRCNFVEYKDIKYGVPKLP